MTTASPDPARLARVAAIRDGATVRQHLGQGTGYVLVDGQHRITLLDASMKIVVSYSGSTLDDAIADAKKGKPIP